MARISTHVLDVARGKPAAGIPVELYLGLATVTIAQTNADGRTDKPLLTAETLEPGGYDLTFHVGDYFRAQGIEAFFEKISISFVVTDTRASYHVPLLLAPYGYSTYRGS
jgi:5-hydroxyisourate hydrolase